MVTRPRWCPPSTGSSTCPRPASRTVAREPVCRQRVSIGRGSSSAMSQSMRKSYVATPAARVATARLVSVFSARPPSTWTPLPCRCDVIISPNTSGPSRVNSVTGSPSRASPRATFAGLPPGWATNVRPPRCPTRSMSASPTTTNMRPTSLRRIDGAVRLLSPAAGDPSRPEAGAPSRSVSGALCHERPFVPGGAEVEQGVAGDACQTEQRDDVGEVRADRVHELALHQREQGAAEDGHDQSGCTELRVLAQPLQGDAVDGREHQRQRERDADDGD